MPYQLIKIAADPNATPFSVVGWLQSHATFITALVGAGKLWYVAIYGHPWSDQIDNAINATLIALLGASVLQGAAKTATAHVVNSIINPTSPAARTLARTVNPEQPPIETPK